MSSVRRLWWRLRGRSSGGYIPSPPAASEDRIPAILSPGCFYPTRQGLELAMGGVANGPDTVRVEIYEDEHIVVPVNGIWRCARPEHAGRACRERWAGDYVTISPGRITQLRPGGRRARGWHRE